MIADRGGARKLSGREAHASTPRERGRQWHYRLDPGPLADVYRDRFSKFAPYWEASLQQLKRQAEDSPDGR